MDIDACIARLTEKDAKAALKQADLSNYPDSMQSLILRDIVAALKQIEALEHQKV